MAPLFLRWSCIVAAFLAVGVTLLAVSCTDPSTQPAWSGPYEQWKSYQIHDYSITQVRTCFCPDGGVPVRVTVRNDSVVSAVRISDNVVMNDTHYCSIDSLFGLIRYKQTADSIVVRYNLRFGYPEYLDINPQMHPVDGGVLYETSNLVVP